MTLGQEPLPGGCLVRDSQSFHGRLGVHPQRIPSTRYNAEMART